MRPLPLATLVRCLLPLLLFLGACDTPEQSGLRAARLAQRQAILSEAPGDYYIGRRYYNSNYKFWGYLRRPGQPWHDAKLVMLNEKEKLAPDRELNQFGVDDNCEYKIYGHYTGDTVYEPASNRFYPEFLLTGYELRDRNPPSIFPPGTRLPNEAINAPD
jgi:hypothetical protein